MSETDWRPVVAALANPHSRRIYAQIVAGVEPGTIGQELSPARRERAVDVLRDAGLVGQDTGGRLVERPEVFGRVLAAAATPRTGIERFLDGRGRVDRYPLDDGERHALLAYIAERVLETDEVVAERELNARLRPFTDDVALLRRHLVDDELLERTRSGSEYARVNES